MALNPFQKEIENLAKSMNLSGSAQQQVYSTPQFQELVNRFFGAIPLPAGINESMVTSRSGGGLEYRDPEGYLTQLTRNLNAVDPRLGQVSQSSTNRPAVLPLGAGQQTQLNNFQGQLSDIFSKPLGLSQLDPQTMALLKQKADAENAQLSDAFQKAQGTTVAQLVGQGVGSSSIAADIMGRLLKDQGLVQSQAQGQQAERQLGIQQFLTQGQQQQNQSLQQFVEQLLGLGTQRDIASGQIGLGKEQLGVQNEQFFAQMQEQIRQFNEQQRMQERQGLINNIFKGVSTAASLGAGLAGGFGGGGSAFSGGGALSSFQAPPINPYGNPNPFGNVRA